MFSMFFISFKIQNEYKIVKIGKVYLRPASSSTLIFRESLNVGKTIESLSLVMETISFIVKIWSAITK